MVWDPNGPPGSEAYFQFLFCLSDETKDDKWNREKCKELGHVLVYPVRPLRNKNLKEFIALVTPDESGDGQMELKGLDITAILKKALMNPNLEPEFIDDHFGPTSYMDVKEVVWSVNRLTATVDPFLPAMAQIVQKDAEGVWLAVKGLFNTWTQSKLLVMMEKAQKMMPQAMAITAPEVTEPPLPTPGPDSTAASFAVPSKEVATPALA